MPQQSLRTDQALGGRPEKCRKDPPLRKKILHIGVHNSANKNAGDTLLFPVVRRAFDVFLGKCDWELRQAWELFTLEDARSTNAKFDGVVIGGGGLLLRDQVGSDITNSGWQWNSTIESIEALQIPIFVFAIGYNRFRGQSEFDPIFTEHLRALVRKAYFFGLRNTGSIEALKKYLPSEQHCKLQRQFCPTNLLWQLFPKYCELAQTHDKRGARLLSFNAAFDRAHLRFGESSERVLNKIARALRLAQDRGWGVILTAHKSMDRQIEAYLDMAGVNYDLADLTNAKPPEILEFYSQIDFAFGMRGHAQMIPFGLRRPIMSIISHDKMRFLLEDIGHLSWGVEVDAEDLDKKFVASLSVVEKNLNGVHSEISKAQQKVWEETNVNFAFIAQAFNKKNSDLTLHE